MTNRRSLALVLPFLVLVLFFGATIWAGQKLYGTLLADQGSTGNPSVAYSADTDTGVYFDVGYVMFSTGGTQRVQVDSTGLTVTGSGKLLLPAMQGGPSLTFSGDSDTGIFNNNTNEMSLQAGGTNTLKVTSGSAVFTQPLRAAQGSYSLPAYAFSGDVDTGIYQVGADQIGFACGGTLEAYVQSDGLRVTDSVWIGAGSESVPGLVFTADGDTGVYRPSVDTVGITCGGSTVATIGTTLTTQVAIQATDGSSSQPGFSFQTDPNTGLFHSPGVADRIYVSTGGTQRFFVSDDAVKALDASYALYGFQVGYWDDADGGTIAADAAGGHYTNKNATSIATFTLIATPPSGFTVTFEVVDSDGLRVDPQAADKIISPDIDAALADGEYIESTTVGSTVTLRSNSDDNWVVVNLTGTWSAEP